MRYQTAALISLSCLSVALANYEVGVNEYYCSAATPDAKTYTIPKDMELKHVQVIVRHGDRTPISILPQQAEHNVFWNCTDETPEYNHLKLYGSNSNEIYNQILDNAAFNPYAKEYLLGTCMTGQLTPKGMRQKEHVGKELRKIYVDKLGYLPKSLNKRNLKKSIFVRHTEKTRTKHTAISLVSGLYPSNKLKGKLAIPFYTLPEHIETMLSQPGQCPRLSKIQKDMLNEPSYNEYWDGQQETKKKMDAILQTENTPAYQTKSLVRYMDEFRPLACNNFPLPCNLNNKSECITNEMAVQSYVGNDFEATWTMRDSPLAAEANRLGIGLFLSELRQSILDSIKDCKKTPAKMEIFSGHDTTVQPLLGVLKAEDFRWPPYASNLIVEVWQEKRSDKAYIRILFNGEVLKSPVCDFSLCPLETFMKLADQYIPKNFVEECKLTEEA
ncbi:phosphoglycerate mutase-like protein [Basidiobolus meristosporus CBS 931.73]|uniref:Phosphoglycerate mutase-like protein n=1 Tax=Basidiobolus meristosporus CBS 931.73 TaxID=1314790 RepID=A0A1Y1YFX4_9FUNG|nr:phosphoglycerate mutase-like protein [Basidiobolus meristosporus CBS 931.73]|eukprot:ORX96887.1 phosphoglycerate mutase-like protein [Basidiobolus meristosporus CBS 931.73]